MENAERSYRAYMLRLWRVESQGGLGWRASVEDTRTGERRGFASLEALLAWLRDEALNAAPPESQEGRCDQPC